MEEFFNYHAQTDRIHVMLSVIEIFYFTSTILYINDVCRLFKEKSKIYPLVLLPQPSVIILPEEKQNKYFILRKANMPDFYRVKFDLGAPLGVVPI